jgi:hypothetical protein
MMRSILPTFVVIALVALPVFSQMKYFDSIIYCAKSIKGMAENVNNIGSSYDNPFVFISHSSKVLRDLGDLLDHCGKQRSAKVYKTLLSKQCINLH